MANTEHGTIKEGPKGPFMTDSGVQIMPSYYIAKSRYTGEEGTFSTYSCANWWLTLIGEAFLSRERRMGYRGEVV